MASRLPDLIESFPYAASPYGPYNTGDQFVFGQNKYSIVHVAHTVFGDAKMLCARTALYLGPFTAAHGVDPGHVAF